MDAIEVLKADHDAVRDLFIQFRAAAEDEDTAALATVTSRIFEELEVHTAIEERLFYPAVAKAGGKALVDLTAESNEEHHVVDLLMAEVRDLSPSDDTYVAKMTVLVENVEHHAGEEEKEMFPKVRTIFTQSELDDLGASLAREKQVVKLERMTVDDLQKAAAELDIPGRSTMNRSELASAVLSAMLGGLRLHLEEPGVARSKSGRESGRFALREGYLPWRPR